ncbi:MAG: Eco57I restriction-modification methylase domain-containing protein [Rhodocyclaceae bacterium]
MTIDAARFQKLLNDLKLEQLFNELGWDRASLKPQELPVSGETFTLTAIAQKRGVAVLRCTPDGAGNIPPRPTLLKIEKEALKLAHEHLLVFADAAQSMLTWLWVSRAPGQPTITRTHTWHKGTSGESLRQKLNQIIWSLAEEEAITLTDVITGLKKAFGRDTVTKKFYERFSAEHEAFADFIAGLTGATDKAWYASLMLNRLMFVYFIQRKGFLDGNINYLADRMQRVRSEAGAGHFHSFYRMFLRRLFHEGLGQAKGARGSDLTKLIGDVPYLNGGLFAVHELEEANPDIDIPDEAFERLFRFFDAYDWHLDDRPLSSGSEINPDVLGYIFEKYINQKQMGAYYTKEDITEYISKNTVVPHLLEQARERCKVAFDGEASVWNLLKADPDRYLYPAMKTGVVDAAGNFVPESALPDFVQAGMKDPKARMFERRYNLGEAVFHTATGERGTLPTETWREYVERRARCLAVREKLAKGIVASADDLITLNLDIRQFMQDVIDTCTGTDLLRAVWQAIVGRVPERANEKFRHGITILDPTCGSGAFLFAALNVLEPLYEACLDRMEGFVEDAKKLGKPVDAEFTKVLDEVGRHHSRRYFIYKNIILHNLFGVDIMAEAVEICKLRLFLKLVSQVDGGRELEPLPDIDFNIRAGNTLVGYATEAQFDATNTLASDQAHRDEIKASTADLADLFDRFREQQTVHGGKVTADDKRKLRDKLNGLSLELDRYLARDYGIDPDKTKAFAAWRESHQPFHWFAEFYGVMHEGGFDVVIGNPPYIQNSQVSNVKVSEYEAAPCGNIYALVIERCLQIVKQSGAQGLIVPVSSVSTEGYISLQSLLVKYGLVASSYDDRPAHLFDGLDKNTLSILLSGVTKAGTLYSTRLSRWNGSERDTLFQLLNYGLTSVGTLPGCIPKLGSYRETGIWRKFFSKGNRLAAHYARNSTCVTYYSRKVNSFLQSLDFVPDVRDGQGNMRPPSEFKELKFTTAQEAHAVFLLLNSSTFRWFLDVVSDGSHLNKREIDNFPFDPKSFSSCFPELADLAASVSQNLRRTSFHRTMRYKHDTLTVQCIVPKNSKKLIDEFDIRFGKYAGLGEDEIDFLINYDIKYRMGGADEEE